MYDNGDRHNNIGNYGMTSQSSLSCPQGNYGDRQGKEPGRLDKFIDTTHKD